MSLIPEVKCRRCGESFSSMRSRCPNCGTRRVSQSGRTPAATPGTVKGTEAYERAAVNTKWQLIFGLILVVAVILAVIVMVSTGLNGADAPAAKTTPTPAAESAAPTPPPAPTPTPTPPPNVEKISIRYYEIIKEDFSIRVDEVVPLNALVTPTDISDKVTWSVDSENEQYVQITVDPEDGNKCEVKCISKIPNGGITLYAELFGVKAQCQIYAGKD
ncbi:MAG: hypothetical protein ACI3VA_11805 [Candidatus Limivicinus sp.]